MNTKNYAIYFSKGEKELFSVEANGTINLKGKKIEKCKELADFISEH